MRGGNRKNLKNCYSTHNNGLKYFNPLLNWTDEEKAEYCDVRGIIHSKCYTEYGLTRTGCVGCPYAKGYKEERQIVAKYEPKLSKAIEKIFGDSYAIKDVVKGVVIEDN